MTQLGNIPFPQNPILNEQFSFADRTWVWDGIAWRDASSDLSPDLAIYVRKEGDDMTGPLGIPENLDKSDKAVPKSYVDTRDDVLIDYLNNLNDRVAALEQESGYASFFATIQAGQANLGPSDFAQLILENVSGTGVTADNGGVRFTTDQDMYCELRGEILNNWGTTVSVYYQWDDEPRTLLGSATIESNDFMYVARSATITQRIGSTITFWITSDFEFAETMWRNGQAIGFTVA